MATPSKRKAPILPPGTYIVDDAAWDKDAPDLTLDEHPKQASKHASKRASKRGPATATGMSTGEPVSRGTGLAVILLFGLVLAAGGGAGVWWMLDRKAQAEARALAEVEAEALAEAEAEARAQAAPPPEDPEVVYAASVAKTAAELGVEAPSLATLLEPNEYLNPVTHGKPAVLAPGGSKRFGSLNLEVHVDTLSLDRHGIRSKGEHTILRIQNTADHPIAYRLDVRKKSNGDCLSLAAFHYDAMVIDAGATIDVSICSGRQSAEILDLRMLSVTTVGARWIRQIPPLAVGNTSIAGRSHKLADETIPQCNEDVAAIARSLEEHRARWEDVIDFFSRHDCQQYAWVSEYRLAKQALPRLPILPEQPDL